jgi:hypothetical protein
MTKKQFGMNAVAFVLAWVALPLLLACDQGCEEHSGVCACSGTPEVAPPVIPSDEKPPKSGMPSYQAEGIKVDTPKSLISEDAKMDDKKAEQAGKASGL